MTVEFGNIYYFMYIFLAVSFIAGTYFVLRNKNERIQKWSLFAVLALNFVLHFLKLAFPPYIDNLPSMLHKVTLENICAISTVLFPFLFLTPKKSIIHDYIYFIGFMGGALALVYPTEALGESPFVFESIRFYLCHTSLIAVPLLSAMLGLHRPRLKKAWAIPLLFYAHETMIMLNEIVLLKTGLIEGTLESFLSCSSRNNSFVHGPTPDMEGIGRFLTFFCPEIFTKDIFGINNGVDFFWPVVWLIIPVIVYFIPIYLLISAPVSAEITAYFNNKKIKDQNI